MKKKIVGLVISAMLMTLGFGTSALAEEGKHANVGLFWIDASMDNTVGYDGWVLCRAGVCESLVKITEDMTYEGLIAESWENDGSLTWIFKIRDGVTFSNGKAVDAEAVKKSIQRSLDNNERAQTMVNIDTMEADGQTLTIKTTKPYASLIGNLADPLFAIVDTEAEGVDFNSAPVCTGPYVITSFTPEENLEVVKNENYWGGDVGLDSITYKHIPDSSTRTMALQSGEVDITGSIDQSQIDVFKNDPENYNVSEIASLRTLFGYINHESQFLSDKNIRKALSCAIDRDSYALMVGGEAATGLFSSVLPFENETLKADQYDLENAQKILDDAGYADTDGDGVREKDGQNIVLQIYQTAAHGSDAPGIIATAMQAQFKEIGIGADILTVENLNQIYEEGKFDITFSNDNTGITADPQSFLEITYKTDAARNYGHYSNEQMDQLIADMDSEFDMGRRYEMAAKASQIALDDVANFYFTYIPLNTVGNKNVKNLVQHPIDYYMITADVTME